MPGKDSKNNYVSGEGSVNQRMKDILKKYNQFFKNVSEEDLRKTYRKLFKTSEKDLIAGPHIKQKTQMAKQGYWFCGNVKKDKINEVAPEHPGQKIKILDDAYDNRGRKIEDDVAVYKEMTTEQREIFATLSRLSSCPLSRPLGRGKEHCPPTLTDTD